MNPAFISDFRLRIVDIVIARNEAIRFRTVPPGSDFRALSLLKCLSTKAKQATHCLLITTYYLLPTTYYLLPSKHPPTIIDHN